MPRKAREKSDSGIYHIILRGTNRQEIFHDDEDSQRFIEILEKYKKKYEVKVHGWCLMGNHLHLLLGEGSEALSATMKRLGVSFVWYYNSKYKTTGHLFQDRFKSEKVDRDEYLLTVIRYIHQNPVKAGIVKRAEDWKWSSCLGYYGNDRCQGALLDSELILEMFSKDKHIAIAKFKEFNEAENNLVCLDESIRVRMTDEKARQKIANLINGIEIANVKSLPKVNRDGVLRKIKELEGITQRQAARLLGVSSSVIFKA